MISHIGLPYAQTFDSTFGRTQPIGRPWDQVYQGVAAGFEPCVEAIDQPQRPGPRILAPWIDAAPIWLTDAVLFLGVMALFLAFAAGQIRRRLWNYLLETRYRRPPTVAS